MDGIGGREEEGRKLLAAAALSAGRLASRTSAGSRSLCPLVSQELRRQTPPGFAPARGLAARPQKLVLAAGMGSAQAAICLDLPKGPGGTCFAAKGGS